MKPSVFWHRQGVTSPHLLLRWARGVPPPQLARQGLLGSRWFAPQQQVQLAMARRPLVEPTVPWPPGPVVRNHNREGGGTSDDCLHIYVWRRMYNE